MISINWGTISSGETHMRIVGIPGLAFVVDVPELARDGGLKLPEVKSAKLTWMIWLVNSP
jgi:hypothetical protein